MTLTPAQLATQLIVYQTAIDYYTLCGEIADAAHLQRKNKEIPITKNIETIEERIKELSEAYRVKYSHEICGLDAPGIFNLRLEYLRAGEPDEALIEVENIRKTIEDKVKAVDDSRIKDLQIRL